MGVMDLLTPGLFAVSTETNQTVELGADVNIIITEEVLDRYIKGEGMFTTFPQLMCATFFCHLLADGSWELIVAVRLCRPECRRS